MEIDIVDSLTKIRILRAKNLQGLKMPECTRKLSKLSIKISHRFSVIDGIVSSVFLASDELPISHQFVICMKIAK